MIHETLDTSMKYKAIIVITGIKKPLKFSRILGILSQTSVLISPTFVCNVTRVFSSSWFQELTSLSPHRGKVRNEFLVFLHSDVLETLPSTQKFTGIPRNRKVPARNPEKI